MTNIHISCTSRSICMSICHANQNTTRRTLAACLWLSLARTLKNSHPVPLEHTKLHKNAMFVFRSVRFETTKSSEAFAKHLQMVLIYAASFRLATPSSKQKNTLLFTWHVLAFDWKMLESCKRGGSTIGSGAQGIRISIEA